MTLIKCPHCGHTVLSVASQCPSCHGTLRSAFLGQEHTGEIAQCRYCGQRVRSRSRACPHCGRPNPASRIGARELLWGGAVVAGIVLAVVVLRPRLASMASPTLDPEPVPVTMQAEPAAAPAARKQAQPAPVSPPVETPPASALRPAPAATPNPLANRRLQARYTIAWANMRAGPDTSAAVLRALPPGTEVNGARGASGWWAIQRGGDSVGYIAGALLDVAPPPDTLVRP